MNKAAAMLLLLTVMLLSACSETANTLLPASSGKPYEVVLTSSDTAAANMVNEALAKNCIGLPQDEPMFDVTQTGNGMIDTAIRMARAIVVVDTDSALYRKASLQYEKNAYAEPQIVVSITAPDKATLRKDMPRLERLLTELLTRTEMNAVYKWLDEHNNPVAERTAWNQMHVRTRIAENLTASKQGQDFLWLSNDAPQAMQNFCLYSYPGNDTSTATFTAKRDSIMKENMPGEKPDMHMTTVKQSVGQRVVKEKSTVRHCYVGLWEMEGDMMGGPFVAHALVDSARNRVVVAEGFVYAPEQNKRNLVRRLEASLYSTRLR